MCWTFCWTKCWTLFLAKIRILPAISISSGDRLGKLLGDGAGEGNRTLVFSLEVSGISLCRNGDHHLSAHSLLLSNCGAQVSHSIPHLHVWSQLIPEPK